MKAMLALAVALLGAGALRGEVVRPDPDDNVQWAASVVQLNQLRNQGDLTVKLFGTAGGDPAMNGLYTYLAFYDSPAEGWRVFRLGDFLTYRVLTEARGRLTLEIRENVMTASTGDIGTRTRRLSVIWTAGPDGTPPAFVNVTAAR